MFDKIAEYSDISNHLEGLIKKKYKELKDRKYGEGKNTYSMFRLHFYQGRHAIEAFEQKDCIVTNLIRIDTDLDSELIKRAEQLL